MKSLRTVMTHELAVFSAINDYLYLFRWQSHLLPSPPRNFPSTYSIFTVQIPTKHLHQMTYSIFILQLMLSAAVTDHVHRSYCFCRKKKDPIVYIKWWSIHCFYRLRSHATQIMPYHNTFRTPIIPSQLASHAQFASRIPMLKHDSHPLIRHSHLHPSKKPSQWNNHPPFPLYSPWGRSRSSCRARSCARSCAA